LETLLKNWHEAHKDGRTTGEIAADKLRNGMGSWPFVGSFLVFMLLWMVLAGFDPFPFILLNLLLSTLAGLQGAILLIAAKRMDAISAAMAQHDFEVNSEALEILRKLDTEILQELKNRSEP
jgi:uncharacterized membrane protein